MQLDLEKLWHVMNVIVEKQDELEEQGKYVALLGVRSEYFELSFESFLEHYSFTIENENIVVYNSDSIPYESWNNEDYSYVPICLLSISAEKIEEWIDNEIEMQLEKQKLAKIAEKEEIKRKIERLTKELEND